MKLDVQNYCMSMHLKTAVGHMYQYDGYIDQPGHEQHGNKITLVKFNPKDKKERPEVHYCVADGTAKPPVFTTLDQLMVHYRLKSSTK